MLESEEFKAKMADPEYAVLILVFLDVRIWDENKKWNRRIRASVLILVFLDVRIWGRHS